MEALIERLAHRACALNFAAVELLHMAIDVIRDLIANGEEMDIDDGALTDADCAPHGLVDDGGIPMLAEKQDPPTELEIETGPAADNLHDDDDGLAILHRLLGSCDLCTGICSAAHRKDVGTHCGGGAADHIHLLAELTEDDGTDLGVHGGLELRHTGGPLGGRRGWSPVRAQIAAAHLFAHSLDIDLGMNEKLLDTQPAFELVEDGDRLALKGTLRGIAEDAEELAFCSAFLDRQIVLDEAGRRRQRRDITAEIGHCAAEHYLIGFHSRRDAEPGAEIAPVLLAVLDGCGGKNPSMHCRSGDRHTGSPPSSFLSIADRVAFVENDALKRLLLEESGIQDDLWIRCEPNSLCFTLGPGRSADQLCNGEAAAFELLLPAGDERWRANNESPQRLTVLE